MSPEPTPLKLYGPPRLQEVVDGLLAMLAPDISYRLAHHADLTWAPVVEVTEVGPGDEFTLGSDAGQGRGDGSPTGRADGRVPHRGPAGASVVLGGDGVPCAGLDELCQGAGAYVQTVLREDIVRMVPEPRGSRTSSTTTRASRTRRAPRRRPASGRSC